jgi:hypothetical protein
VWRWIQTKDEAEGSITRWLKRCKCFLFRFRHIFEAWVGLRDRVEKVSLNSLGLDFTGKGVLLDLLFVIIK